MELKQRDDAEWSRLFRAVAIPAALAESWAPVFTHVLARKSFSAGETDLADFLPTILVESQGLSKLKESGYYSPERIRELGNRSKPDTRWHSLVPRADEIAWNEAKFFEACYGGRLGNGPEGSGDGALYPGRGLIMLTGKNGYLWQSRVSGQDLIGLPQLAEQPHFALEFAIDWWEGKVPDMFLGDVPAVRRVVNGGDFGLVEVQNMKRKLLAAGL